MTTRARRQARYGTWRTVHAFSTRISSRAQQVRARSTRRLRAHASQGPDRTAAPRVPFGPYHPAQTDPRRSPRIWKTLAELKQELGAGQLFGLPTVTQADDLGEREVSKAARRHSGAGSSSAQPGGSRTPAHEVYYRTVCGALRVQTPSITGELNERSHMRLVMKMVGRLLYDFSSTRELVQAFRDAIVGTSPHRIH